MRRAISMSEEYSTAKFSLKMYCYCGADVKNKII